ncbi:flagellar protein FliT [Virgibacillus ainsalahensis]
MNRLQPLYDVTLQLKEVIDQEITSQNRDTIVEQVNQLVEQRGYHMKELTPPYTQEEKYLGEKLIELNVPIQQSMNQLFAQLKEEMKQVKKQRKSNRKYINPYANVRTMDGMFMDSKK